MGMIVGSFHTHQAASRAVDDLMSGGFPADQISIHTQDGKIPTLSPEGDTMATPAADRTNTGTTNRAPFPLNAGVLAATGTGATIGDTAGEGAGAGGTYAGGLVGLFLANGHSREDAEYYSNRAHAGKYLVAVQTTASNEIQAMMLLETAGAEPRIERRPS